jgi:glycosyltransferase involved in cell wall biosynthesis
VDADAINVVLYVHSVDAIGGAEKATWRLAQRMAQNGAHHVTLLTTQPLRRWLRGSSLVERTGNLRIIRLPVLYRNERIYRLILQLGAILAIPLLMHRTQVLHTRKLDASAIGLARLAHRRKIKTVCVPLASGPYGDVVRFPATSQRDPEAFDWISALTEAVRQEVIAWGYPAERTGVIPNGVDVDYFSPCPESQLANHVLYVGQLRPEKRIGLLLEAWHQVQASHSQARLTLIGGANRIAEYRKMAADLDIAPTFIPDASSEEVRDQLRKGAIFVLPGISEGMSNALLEAMSVGLACVASDTPGNRAVIDPEVNGLVYDGDSADQLAAQLDRLLNDSTLRERLGQAARESVVKHYSLDSVVEQYLALYRRLVSGQKLDPAPSSSTT